MSEAYIVAAKRTAVGSFMGALSGISATNLGSYAIQNILGTTKIPFSEIDEVIMGQVLTGGSGQNPARQAMIEAGLPNSVPAFTINKVCGSGLKAVMLAANAIRAGQGHVYVAGGQENMSLSLHGAYIRKGSKFGSLDMVDFMLYDGLTDAFSGKLMGITAENISKKFSISREQQDHYALESQKKASSAQKSGYFKNEIIPIEIKKRKETEIFQDDEGIRADSNIESLGKLKPAFDQDGSVTAGNSSTINDGAAALLVVSAEALKKYNLTALAKIVSHASAGVDPSIMGTGPVPASQKALKLAGWKIGDLDLIEANEAFAAQSLYVSKYLEADVSKINICGGAIAIGHPIGASGARVLTTLVHQMHRVNAKKGLATLCIGGGMGVAICIEKA